MNTVSSEPLAGPATSRAYAWYVTSVLLLCYTLSFTDAHLPFILVEAIKADMRLSDTQIGLITGPAFSVAYALSVVPLARLSDRFGRKYVIGGVVTVWSLFTAAGGLARSFTGLMVSRIGVAIGEGGLTPAAHSLITDYFDTHTRPRAIAIYSCGITLGGVTALMFGGVIADTYGWRMAMFLVAATGLLVTLVLLLTVREPVRSQVQIEERSGTFFGDLRRVFGDAVLRNTIIGGTILCVAYSSATAWTPAYIIRTYGLTASQTGASFGPVMGVLSLVGTLAGGFIANWLSRRDPRYGFWFLACAFVLSAACRIFALMMGSYAAFLVVIAPATLLLMMYPGPTYATVQSRAPSGIRSFTTGITLFFFHGMGLAAGAFLTGWLSDLLAPALGKASLGWALGIGTMALLPAAFFYLRAARHQAE